MNFRPMLVASLLLPASASFAAIGDTCTPDVVNEETGEVTEENFTERCEGTQFVICAEDDAGATVETAIECATFGGITGGTCGNTVGGDPFCFAPDGEGCLFNGQAGAILLPCATADSGCIDGVCTAGQGACTPPAAAADLACTGDAIDFGCTGFGQVLEMSCGLFGAINAAPNPSLDATCTGAGDTLKCVGVAEGDSCATGFFECAADDCVGESATTFGTCGQEGEGEGEGEGEDDDDGGNGRDDEPEPAPGGCSTTAGLAPVFGAALLALIAVRRRRA